MSLCAGILKALLPSPGVASGEADAVGNPGKPGVHANAQSPSERTMQLSPLSLAYMGDTVYDLYTRTLLIETSDLTAHGLHMLSAKRVCAAAQAKAAETLFPVFTEQELSIYKRGRNAHMGTIPKNATIAQYRAATGLEAVIGYLYISGNDERLHELMRLALQE